MAREMTLPELGENIESAEVTSVLVSAGDTIEIDQPVLELETDKATAEVPAEFAGKVREVKVKAGDQITVGQVLLTVDDDGDDGDDADGSGDRQEPDASKDGTATTKRQDRPGGEASEGSDDAEAEAEAPARTDERDGDPDERDETRAGDAGTDEDDQDGGRTSRQATPQGESDEQDTAADMDRPRPDRREPAARPAPPPASDAGTGSTRAPASPAVRRLARELGVDISAVPDSSGTGRISADDVKAYARRLIADGGSAPAPATGRAGSPAGGRELPDFERWGQVEREPMSSIRRRTAANLAQSWASIPLVTQFDRADITAMESFRKKHGPTVEAAGGKLTPTAIVVKVVAAALHRFPQFNASLDLERQEIVYKRYVNVGVAVDTERGLLVPVIKDVDGKSLTEIAVELTELADKARSRKASMDDLSGGTFTVTNLGGLGTTYFSPLVNWPEVAILGTGRATLQPVWEDGQFAPRRIMPLSLSYDHRLIDGADTARCLRWIAEALENPFVMLLEG